MKVDVQIGKQFDSNIYESEIRVDIPEESNVLDLCDVLTTKFRLSEGIFCFEDTEGKKNFKNFIVINSKVASPLDVLKHNDKVIILPVMIGG